MPSSSRELRPIPRNLGGQQPSPTTTQEGAATSTPLFPSPEPSSSQRIGVSTSLQWGVIAACFVAVSALILMRYLRLRKQGGAVTWRQVFSTQRSYSRSLLTSSQRNFTYPRSRPTAGPSSNLDSAGYPLPADMFLPTLPQRAARAEGRRGAQGATIGPGGRRDVGEEEEEAGNELPAYESARKTGLPDYQFEEVQLSHPLASSPSHPPPPSLPPALGAVAAASSTSPPPPPSLPSSSPSPPPHPSQDPLRPPTPSPEVDLADEEEERRRRRG